MPKFSLLSFITLAILCQSCNADELNLSSYVAKKIDLEFEYDPNKNTQKFVVGEDSPTPKKPTPTALPVTSDDHVNIVAVGDIMIGSSFPNVGFLPPHDGKYSFKEVKPYLKGDVVFGNLEGVLLDEGNSTKCPSTPAIDPETGQPKPITCYAFRMPTRYGKIIKDAGFTLLSLANNHTGDFGDIGRTTTVQTLNELDIHHAGLLSKPTTTFTKNGVKYGMVAFAPNIGTVSINDLNKAKQYVKELDKKVDIVIVSFHGGAEGANHTRVPKTTEMYLNENRGDVYKFSHSLIDVGADIVIGHGPHVTRAVEVYKDRFIAYSLGNFNTYGAFNVRGVNGIAPIVNAKLKKNGEFISADITSIYQTKDKGLMVDKNHQAFKELKKLTELDFPDSGLIFSDNKITRKK